MKKLIVPLCIAAIQISSCSKTPTTTTPTTTTTTPTSTGSTPTPVVSNVDGGLVSLKVDVATTTAGYTVNVTTESAVASFFTTTGNNSTFTDGGAVSVNSNALEKQTNNSYLKTITPGPTTTADLNFSSNNSNWSVGGAGTVPAFTYNHSTTFPTFTGSIPDAITRSAGVTVTFNGKVSDADSVMIFIVKGNASITRTFAGTATSGTIAAADLASLPVVSDKSGIMEVIPYSFKVKAQGTKNYAFIKERAVLGYINIQ